MNDENIVYLGDGVYCKKEGSVYCLMANDHRHPTDTIFMEDSEINNLIEFVNKCRQEKIT